jgi:drug/metabolite transporter (DMT)-like permease
VSALVLALVLCAAFAHAGWNLLSKGAQGGAVFVWLSMAFGVVAYLPAVAIALAVDPGRLDWLAVGLMAGSGALHVGYFTALQRGYDTGDLSLVYPLARGTGPLLSSAAAIAFLGERPGALALAGGLTIVIAVLSLVGRPTVRGETGRAVTFALATGVAIAAYTLWDKQSVDKYALSPVIYLWGMNLANAALLTPLALHRRDALRAAWTTSRGRAAGVAILSPLAYVLVLFALARAPVSIVAPARECSIVVGTLLGTTVLGEGDRRRRVIASVAIVAGIAALAAG